MAEDHQYNMLPHSAGCNDGSASFAPVEWLLRNADGGMASERRGKRMVSFGKHGSSGASVRTSNTKGNRCPFCGIGLPSAGLKKVCIKCMKSGNPNLNYIWDSKYTKCPNDCGSTLREICLWDEKVPGKKGKLFGGGSGNVKSRGCGALIPLGYIGSKATFIFLVGSKRSGKSQYLTAIANSISSGKFGGGGEAFATVSEVGEKSIRRSLQSMKRLYDDKQAEDGTDSLRAAAGLSGTNSGQGNALQGNPNSGGNALQGNQNSGGNATTPVSQSGNPNPNDILGDDGKITAKDPLVLSISGDDGSLEYMVIYDRAGEDLSSESAIAETTANFLANADAILYCMDPTQLCYVRQRLHPPSEESIPKEYEANTKILNYISSVIDRDVMKSIVLAVVLTKADLLMKDPEDSGEESIVLDENLKDAMGREYDHDNMEYIDQIVRSYLAGMTGCGDSLGNFINQTSFFADCRYFLTSALGYDPKGKKIDVIALPFRQDEPLLWILAKNGSKFVRERYDGEAHLYVLPSRQGQSRGWIPGILLFTRDD